MSIIDIDNHHVNFYTQNQNITVREDNDKKIVKHSCLLPKKILQLVKSKTARDNTQARNFWKKQETLECRSGVV